ncbi:hypothetical protein F4779DRAFT_625482 [Xylariaceae sp. FL0662B]|nr:hypothetical protein F4779DRAFT_625482 [Xylariaceae sp. FL0662B]
MPDFEFVNVARPDDVKHQSTRIRRHVMKDIGKSRRKPRAKKRSEIVLGEHIASACGDSGVPTTTDNHEILASQALTTTNPNADSSLNTTVYPIEMNEERLNLVRFMVEEARSVYRPFRFPWLSMGLSDASAWYITLANAELLRNAEPGLKKLEFSSNVEATKWYTLSLASIIKRLADPAERGSEGLSIAVVGSICHDASVGNFGRMEIHMRGLKRIVENQGGLEALSSPFLRLMISWYDLAIATYLNISPFFGVPRGSITEIDTGNDTQYLEELLRTWNANCPALGDIMGAIRATAAVASYINRYSDQSGFWKDDITGARLLAPAFHEILRLDGRPLPEPSDHHYSAVAAREAFRRAALVFLAAVKVRMGAGAYEMERHLEAFRQISQLPLVDWAVVPELSLWAHVTSAMQEDSHNRAWHVLTIVGIMQIMGLQTGNQALDLARGIIWVDALAIGKTDILCREIDGLIEANMLQQLHDLPLI